MEVLRQENNNYLQEPIATGINYTCRATHKMFAATPRMQAHPILQKKERRFQEVKSGALGHAHRVNGNLDV